jgi:hypothetical protein
LDDPYDNAADPAMDVELKAEIMTDVAVEDVMAIPAGEREGLAIEAVEMMEVMELREDIEADEARVERRLTGRRCVGRADDECARGGGARASMERVEAEEVWLGGGGHRWGRSTCPTEVYDAEGARRVRKIHRSPYRLRPRSILSSNSCKSAVISRSFFC